MKLQQLPGIFLAASILCFSACNNEDKKTDTETPGITAPEVKLKEESVSYTGDGITMNGFVAYDENKEGARPAVMIVHEWWGLNDYIRKRARDLASMGYIAFAVDLFGNGKLADNPGAADS